MKKQMGHYEIVAEIGRGGMGVVYKGYEPALARYVAIKELSPAFSHDTVVVERFLREARSMAALNDPHIIQIYSIGQENDEPFFVMEFVDGVSVGTLIKRDGHLDVDDALKIVLETARGLATAHDHGVIHRDIKPANLMINQRGMVKIADFGIALANHDASAKLTSAGDVVGTAAYLSPEATQGHPVDPRSEVYSVGVVLFEMLCGRTPFSDANVYKLMHDVVETPIPDIREFNPGIDDDVVAILSRMLAKDPAERFQSMHEVIDVLKKHPSISSGPLKVAIPPPSGSTGTIVGLATPMTPGGRPRVATPPPEVGKRQPTTTPQRTTAENQATGGPAQPSSEAPATPTSALRSASAPLILSLLMFLAGVTFALRGQISDFFASSSHGGTTAASSAPAPTTIATPGAMLSAIPVTAYVEAGIVTVLGMVGMGLWFGVYRRRQGETEAGIHALVSMRWRDCIGLVLEVLGREGFTKAPTPRPTGDGGTEFLLLRGNDRVLLSCKLGSTYRIQSSSVSELAKGMEMEGATNGILLTLGSIDEPALIPARRYHIELIDGAALWPKARPFLPTNVLDHVRLQVGSQTRNGLLIGAISSVLLGMATFLFVGQPSAEAGAARTAASAAVAPRPAAASESLDAIKKRIAADEAKRAEVASLTPVQLAERRVKAAGEIATIAQVKHAHWQSESTLELDLKQDVAPDANLVKQICGVLARYDELRLARLQIDPFDPATGTVSWGQCQ